MFFRDERLMEVLNNPPPHFGRRHARPNGEFSGLVDEEDLRQDFKNLDSEILEERVVAVDNLESYILNNALLADMNQIEGSLEALQRAKDSFSGTDFETHYPHTCQRIINCMLNKPHGPESSILGSWYPGKYVPELGRVVEGYNPAFPAHLQPWGEPNGVKPKSHPSRDE